LDPYFTSGYYIGAVLFIAIVALVFWFVGRWGWGAWREHSAQFWNHPGCSPILAPCLPCSAQSQSRPE